MKNLFDFIKQALTTITKPSPTFDNPERSKMAVCDVEVLDHSESEGSCDVACLEDLESFFSTDCSTFVAFARENAAQNCEVQL